MIRVVRPNYISLTEWADALVYDYSNEPLPRLEDEEKWMEWGAIVANTGIFSRANIPSPFNIEDGKKVPKFEDWQQWAEIVYALMSNE